MILRLSLIHRFMDYLKRSSDGNIMQQICELNMNDESMFSLNCPCYNDWTERLITEGIY
jgi:hypothetical protein